MLVSGRASDAGRLRHRINLPSPCMLTFLGRYGIAAQQIWLNIKPSTLRCAARALLLLALLHLRQLPIPGELQPHAIERSLGALASIAGLNVDRAWPDRRVHAGLNITLSVDQRYSGICSR